MEYSGNDSGADVLAATVNTVARGPLHPAAPEDAVSVLRGALCAAAAEDDDVAPGAHVAYVPAGGASCVTANASPIAPW